MSYAPIIPVLWELLLGGPWGFSATPSSQTGKLHVQWETMSQKIRWEVSEDETWYWPWALPPHTYPSSSTHTHLNIHAHVRESERVRERSNWQRSNQSSHNVPFPFQTCRDQKNQANVRCAEEVGKHQNRKRVSSPRGTKTSLAFCLIV